MEIEILQYLEEDESDVLEMMTLFNAIDGYDFDPRIGKENLKEFTSNAALGVLYVIKLEKQNIGYIVLTFGFSFEYKGRDAFIDEFFIKKAYRNKGVGRKTLDFIAVQAKELNVNVIHLEVERHNQVAHNLYVSKGFCSNDRVLLTKKI